MGTIQEKLNYLSTTKSLIKQAIIDKGQSVADTDTFRSYADKISAISGGDLNIFVQPTEPETKKGIWLKRDSVDISGVVESNNVLLEGEWQPDGVYTPVPFEKRCYKEKAAIIGNCIYVFGGNSSTYSTSALKYNILTNSYTKLTDIPVAFSYGTAIAIGTDIFLISPYNSESYNFLYKYDTLTDTYTQLTAPPLLSTSQSAINSAVAIGTDIYCRLNKTMYKYDTLTDTWAQLSTIVSGTALFEVSLAVVGTEIFMFGQHLNTTTCVYKYNVSTNTCVQLNNSPYSMVDGAIVAVGTNIYLFNDTKAYKYDTLTDTYTQLTNIPFEFSKSSAVYYDNKIFLIGGYENWNKIQCLSLIDATFAENNVIINQSKYADSLYKAQLFSSPLLLTDIPTYFYDVYLYKNSKIEKDIPTYIGDGTQWTCFKNEPIDTEGATE